MHDVVQGSRTNTKATLKLLLIFLLFLPDISLWLNEDESEWLMQCELVHISVHRRSLPSILVLLHVRSSYILLLHFMELVSHCHFQGGTRIPRVRPFLSISFPFYKSLGFFRRESKLSPIPHTTTHIFM